jgi:hypothetical protein
MQLQLTWVDSDPCLAKDEVGHLSGNQHLQVQKDPLNESLA